MPRPILGNELHSCPHCGRGPFVSERGLTGHISKMRHCREARGHLAAANANGEHRPSPAGLAEQESDRMDEDEDHPGHHPTNLFASDDMAADLDEPPNVNNSSNSGDAGPEPLNPQQNTSYIIKKISGAAKIFDDSEPSIQPETQWDRLKSLENPRQPFHPWASLDEFEVVDWLSSSGLSQAKIDDFLNLSWVMLFPSSERTQLHLRF
jgi:hypothetical protein